MHRSFVHGAALLVAALVTASGCELMPRVVLDPVPPRQPGPSTPTPGPSTPAPSPPGPTPPAPTTPSDRGPSLVELDEMASSLLRHDRSGQPLSGTIVEDAQRSGGVAAIQYAGSDSIIFVHPEARRRWGGNTWAFIIGHELSHALLQHTGGGPEMEWEADANGARLATDAGYDVAGYVSFVCTLPNTCSRSHGCFHDRMRRLEDQYDVQGACGMSRSAHAGHGTALGLPGASHLATSLAAGTATDCVRRAGPCTHGAPPCRIQVPMRQPDGTYEMREIDAPFCIR